LFKNNYEDTPLLENEEHSKHTVNEPNKRRRNGDIHENDNIPKTDNKIKKKRKSSSGETIQLPTIASLLNTDYQPTNTEFIDTNSKKEIKKKVKKEKQVDEIRAVDKFTEEVGFIPILDMHKHSVAYLQKAIATFAKITPITNTSQQVKELTTTQNNIEEKESIDNNKIKCEDIKRNIEGIIPIIIDDIPNNHNNNNNDIKNIEEKEFIKPIKEHITIDLTDTDTPIVPSKSENINNIVEPIVNGNTNMANNIV